MNKIRFNYKFLLFLYAYLRHIDLSLDRSRWGNWNELKAYYKNQINPVVVAAKLIEQSELEPVMRVPAFSPEEPTKWQKCINLLFVLFTRQSYMTSVEVQYCYDLLNKYEALVNSDRETYDLEAERFRVEVALLYDHVLKFRLLKKDVNHAMPVKCFLQAFNIKPVWLKNLAADCDCVF